MLCIHVLEMVLVQMARTQKNKATSQHLGLLKVSPDSRFAELPTTSNSGLWFQSLQRSLCVLVAPRGKAPFSALSAWVGVVYFPAAFVILRQVGPRL
jgi:hypothetical protein